MEEDNTHIYHVLAIDLGPDWGLSANAGGVDERRRGHAQLNAVTAELQNADNAGAAILAAATAAASQQQLAGGLGKHFLAKDMAEQRASKLGCLRIYQQQHSELEVELELGLKLEW